MSIENKQRGSPTDRDPEKSATDRLQRQIDQLAAEIKVDSPFVTNLFLEEAQMANSFGGVSQAYALIAVMKEGYHLMSAMFQKPADNSWMCFAEKEFVMYMVVVNRSGIVSVTQL